MHIQKLLWLGFLFCGSAHAMIKHENETESLWNTLKKEGPVASLAFTQDGEMFPGFERVEIDKNGRVLGWLTVKGELPLGPEMPEGIFVAVKLHTSGYSITFVDKEGNKLPDGLYLWRSSDKVRLLHPDGIAYAAEKACSSIYWRNQEGKIASDVRYMKGRLTKPAKDAFEKIPSIVEAFGGSYRVFLCNITPHTVRVPAVANYYKDMTDEERNSWFALYPPQDLKILMEWLEEKMKSSGLTKEEMHQIGRQYLVERLISQVFFASGYPVPHEVDIYDLLADIDDIRECSPEQRKAFNEYLKSDDRRDAITGYSKIVCVGGMYQWD